VSAAVSPSDAPVRNDDGATVALLLSVLGLMGCLPVGAAGLAMGYLARERIQAADGALGGAGTARAAILIGWVAVSISVLALLALAVAAALTRLH
jgi:hypothetical protein